MFLGLVRPGVLFFCLRLFPCCVLVGVGSLSTLGCSFCLRLGSFLCSCGCGFLVDSSDVSLFLNLPVSFCTAGLGRCSFVRFALYSAVLTVCALVSCCVLLGVVFW